MQKYLYKVKIQIKQNVRLDKQMYVPLCQHTRLFDFIIRSSSSEGVCLPSSDDFLRTSLSVISVFYFWDVIERVNEGGKEVRRGVLPSAVACFST